MCIRDSYHLSPNLAPGGMQGVTIFFVLSGYLITRLLLSEYDGTCLLYTSRCL